MRLQVFELCQREVVILDLTDGEVANAVAYMANQGGANFKAGKK
jgi:hypothetical protein